MSDQHRITNQKDGSVFVQDAGDTILRAALRAGHGLAYECNSGGCGGCKFELLDGEIETLWPEAPGLSERDKRRGRHLACQCRAVGDVSIAAPSAEEYRPRIAPQRHTARLIDMRQITHDIREFRFAVPGEARFLPGQYAMLHFPGHGIERAYSVSNTANAAGEWHFQIRRVAGGKGTEHLFEQLEIGNSVDLDGPFGVAYLRTDAPRDIVCVGGGSGLAPMISIARGAAEAGLLGPRHLYFLYGARTERDVCGEDMLAALGGLGEYIHFIPVVSQPEAPEQWLGATGFVHEQLSVALPEALSAYEFYFAGPPPMTQAIQELLMVEHKVPFGQIHFDRFF